MVKQEPTPSDTEVQLKPPRWYPEDWREKIDIAKKEREAARRAKGNKPVRPRRRRS